MSVPQLRHSFEESDFDAVMRRGKWWVSPRIIWTLLLVLLIYVVTQMVLPLSKHVMEEAASRPQAWFRFVDGNKQLVGIEIGDRKIPAEKLTKEQKKKIQRGEYDFAGWVDPKERWGRK